METIDDKTQRDGAGRQRRLRLLLPIGCLDEAGQRQRHAWMRSALARDEIEALEDPRVAGDPEYVLVVLLARVLEIDGLPQVTTRFLESLTLVDLRYLERAYRELNGYPAPDGETADDASPSLVRSTL